MTEQRRKILWLDNDRGLQSPYTDFLTAHGCSVRSIETAIEAEEALRDERYDLVILDVMIPTLSDEEELSYAPDETNLGYKTGLIFWKRNREHLISSKTPVLVLTVRLDEGIKEEFEGAGLPNGNFANKYELAMPKNFLDKILSVMQTSERPQEES